MEDKPFSKFVKIVPGVIAILFVVTLFVWLTIGIKEILTPTVLTVILIIILLPFQEENKTLKVLIGAIICLYVFWFISLIATTLLPFAISMVIAYIFDPFVTYLERKKLSRTMATLLLMVILILIFIIMLIFIIPTLGQEISNLVEQVPVIQSKLTEWFKIIQNLKSNNLPKGLEWLGKLAEYEPPPEVQGLLNNLLTKVEESIPHVTNKIWLFVSSMFSNVLQFILGLLGLIIIPVLTFYMLKEANEIKEFFIQLVPYKSRDQFFSITSDINIAMSSFLRGQLLIASVVGILTALCLYLIGIKFALLIGVIAGIVNVVPYLGTIISIIPAITFALFTPSPILSVILVIVSVGAIHFVDGYILSPKILGESLKLNPLMIMMGIIIGGHLYGFWGMLLAIPSICLLKVFFDRWFNKYRKYNKKSS